tara:strand:- start:491 stop:892 length:402 start_codon:yes stop_codon:yes gene_type:complete
MAYDNFTKEVLFSDSKVNILCNCIYNILEAEFTKASLDTKFCITGTVAKIIQGAALTDIPVIPFITNDDAIYKFCSTELPKLLNMKAFALKNRIQYQWEGVYLELWLTNDTKTINTVNGFLVQDTAVIPTNIK